MADGLRVEVEPAEVGLDAARLGRLDRYFGEYVEDGRLAGYLVSVARHGRVAHLGTAGLADREAGLAVDADTLWRLYSMTKPVTSVAVLMLLEEGRFELTDPVGRYLPAFAEARVYEGPGTSRPAREPIRIWHLLTHTAGLTYSFLHDHPVDQLYRDAGLESGPPDGMDLAALCDLYGGLPLLFEPGSHWNYSVATDVLGRLVEVLSGQPFDEFLAERVFAPLGMVDTGFFVPPEKADRLAALYGRGEAGRATPVPVHEVLRRPAVPSGGGGLVGSAADYHRFMELLRRRGELDGVRLLGPRTVDYLASNHLPGGADLRAFGTPVSSDEAPAGVGFGLGVSVTIDPVAAKVPSGPGEYGWTGAASTAFFVDPREDLTVQFLTQLLPYGTYPILPRLKQLVYQSIVDGP
jgi:CubicO group peptidase (beta-lactamase class C family)